MDVYRQNTPLISDLFGYMKRWDSSSRSNI
jgi:hypothetical protein